MVPKFISVIVLSYSLGAIPFGLIAARLIGKVDVREFGSGKIGGTNVLRIAGKKAAALALLGDVGKGVGVVLLAKSIIGTGEVDLGNLTLDYQAAQAMAALVAVIGHNWSAYIKFQGGRGVATFFGSLLVMSYPIALMCSIGVTLFVAALTRYMSLGSILGVPSSFLAMLPLVLLRSHLFGIQPEYLIFTGLASVLILFQHRDNIQRLFSGTERKIGEKATKREPL